MLGQIGDLVDLSRQQRFEFPPCHLGAQVAKRLLRLGNHALILLGFAELDHSDLVVEFTADALDSVELILERTALLHQALRLLAVIPEARVFCELGQFVETFARFRDVKDASSAVRRTA